MLEDRLLLIEFCTHPDMLGTTPRKEKDHRWVLIGRTSQKTTFRLLRAQYSRRLDEILTAIAGQSPFAVQTMVYFKPPGAKGQNLHQDNTYLQVQPGTCLAAWLALDDCDEENGCMMVVPGSQDLPVICQVNTPGLDEICWYTLETPLPPGTQAVPALMKRGDVLFFNGSVIHGSYMNRSADRFRRTLIGHYIMAETEQVAKYYFPVFRMDGSRLDDEALKLAPGGGPCSVYQSTDEGYTTVQEGGKVKEATSAH